MKKFFVIILVFISLLAGCKQVMDETEVSGRVVDIVTGEGVEGVEILLREDENGLTPDACGGNILDDVTSDANGNFSFTFKARPTNKWQYFVSIYEYSQSFMTIGTQTQYFTSDSPFAKHQPNTVEFKVARKAELKTIVSNDTFPSSTDTLRLKTNHPILNYSPVSGNTIVGAIGTVEGSFITYPAGLILYELDIYKKGVWHHRIDSVYVQPGSKTVYTIRY